MDSINGAVPAEQLKEIVGRIERAPPHPGAVIRDLCLGNSISVRQAARILSIQDHDLERVLECRSPVSPELAQRMEAAGWSTASLWLDLQADYDLAQARARRGEQVA